MSKNVNFAIERQKKILEIIQKNGSMKVDDIVEKYKISKMTAWRDLKELEEKGLITKVYGGAVRKDTENNNEIPVDERARRNHAIKQKLAAYVVKNFLKDDQILFLDGGSTVAEIVPLISQSGITIITNGLRTLNLAAQHGTKIRMVCTGGEIRAKSLTLIGDYAIPVIEFYTAHIFLTSGTGLGLENGISDPDLLEASIKKEMKKRSKKIIALMDSSKFGKNSGVKSLNIEDIDILITDRKAPIEILKKMEERGVIYHIVD